MCWYIFVLISCSVNVGIGSAILSCCDAPPDFTNLRPPPLPPGLNISFHCNASLSSSSTSRSSLYSAHTTPAYYVTAHYTTLLTSSSRISATSTSKRSTTTKNVVSTTSLADRSTSSPIVANFLPTTTQLTDRNVVSRPAVTNAVRTSTQIKPASYDPERLVPTFSTSADDSDLSSYNTMDGFTGNKSSDGGTDSQGKDSSSYLLVILLPILLGIIILICIVVWYLYLRSKHNRFQVDPLPSPSGNNVLLEPSSSEVQSSYKRAGHKPVPMPTLVSTEVSTPDGFTVNYIRQPVFTVL